MNKKLKKQHLNLSYKNPYVVNLLTVKEIQRNELKKKKRNAILLSHKNIQDYFLKYQKPKKKLERQKKLLQQKKSARKHGTLYLQCAKRNIFLNLSDSKDRLKVTISIGYIKAKGKARRALFFYKKLAEAFTQRIIKSQIKKIHLLVSGKIYRKPLRILLKALKSKKKIFRIIRCTRKIRLPHNGCRPRKMRRK